MDSVNDIQQRIFNGIKMQLPKGEKLSVVLQDTLHLSQDAVYRRMRGDVPLTIYETKTLCEKFGLSFDDFGTLQKGKVTFDYNPLDTYSANIRTWLQGLIGIMGPLRQLEGTDVTISINESPMLQLLNLPHLTRFKFFFWAKTYLDAPEFRDQKFKREKIDREILNQGIELLNIYNAIPTVEIYGPETLRGTLRQIEYYFDSHQFEDPSYALELLDNLSELLDHMKHQAEVGRKFTRGNEPPTAGNEFTMYSIDTFIHDNTFMVKWNEGKAVFLTHNVINYLGAMDPFYAEESEFILSKLIENSSQISKVNAKERERFFSNIERTIQNFRRKVESELEF